MKFFILSFRAVLLLSFLSLSSCHFFYKDIVVLQINSKKWKAPEFSKLLAQKIRAKNIKDFKNKTIKSLKEELIGDLLMAYLLKKWAKQHAIFVSEEELNQALTKTKKSFPSDKLFFLYLKRKKLSKEEWKNIIKNKLLYKKVSQKISSQAIDPKEKEMQDYYQNHLSFFKKPEKILIHHVFHKKKPGLLKIKQALGKEKNLIAKAKKFLKSSQITRAKWIEKNTLPVFDKAFRLKKKEISPIWQSSYAYHIIQVLEKSPARTQSFLEVKEQIRKSLLAKKRKALFLKWLDKESQKVNVLKNESALKKIKIKAL